MRNRLLKSFVLFALLATVFAGCKEDEPTYKVKVVVTEGGTVEGQNGEYEEGETVVLTAVPADGYFFHYWSNGSTDNPLTITVSNKDITLTANFERNPYVNICASDNGTIDAEVSVHYGRFAPGSSVTVTAKPADGYYFACWSDDNTDNPRTITVGRDDISLAALFLAPTVDLGLESGTLWATCNLGATAPWESGDNYAWGETQTKDFYSWETYKYCDYKYSEYGDYYKFTKYCYDADFGNNGFTDALTTLEAADDAATAVLGAGWAMPTNADWKELDSQCYWVWTEEYKTKEHGSQYNMVLSYKNVSGYIVYKAKSEDDKGKIVRWNMTPLASYSPLADAHIFLPCSVYINGGFFFFSGDYWSSSLCGNNPRGAYSCSFNSNGVYPSENDTYRYNGLSIRPVRRK